MSQERPILVVGATGLLGAEIVRLLRLSGHSVRALVRTTAAPEKRRALEAFDGVEVALGDLKDPPSLDNACRGVGAVVSTASSTLSRQEGDSIETVDERGQLELVAAAGRAKAERFVFVSFAPNEIDFALQRAKRKVEAALSDSGMSHAILRPTFYTEVWLGPALGFDVAGGRVRILGDGTRPVSWISYRDVARFAVAACESHDFSRTVVPLGGPDALSPLEVVGIFEELGAAKPVLEHVPEAALEAQRSAASSPIEEAFASLMLGVARGQVVDTRDELELLPGRLTTVREYARAVLHQIKENEP